MTSTKGESYLETSRTYRIDNEDIDSSHLYLPTENDEAFAAIMKTQGLELLGWYEPSSLSESKDSPFDPIEGIGLPVVAFRYYKTNEEGVAESSDRVIIWDGQGYGTHPGHSGQEESAYIAGREVGRIVDGSLKYQIPADGGRRNYSMDCIVGGDRGDNPIDARTGVPLVKDV